MFFEPIFAVYIVGEQQHTLGSLLALLSPQLCS